ncbi:MAG: 3-isopropylmalate dehydratase small subunit [candidate division Zixibacteria bacterium]|nr:3-isopropylmalate dehydratase small subunit [candidate division Zixibacteria bacterium]
MEIKGKVYRVGENINTDVIMPGRWCHLTDDVELAKHCMEDLDADFAKKISPGDVIVADDNFGCGSSREVAPLSMKAVGIGAVVAKSFARIFYRNSINIGLPIFESPECVEVTEAGDELEIDMFGGKIVNLTKGKEFSFAPFPPFMKTIIEKGGLKGWVLEKLGKQA